MGSIPVGAVCLFCGLSLAQIKVDEKSNETTAIPKLLDMIDIEGCTISIDAMGCQKDIAAKIISKKADSSAPIGRKPCGIKAYFIRTPAPFQNAAASFLNAGAI